MKKHSKRTVIPSKPFHGEKPESVTQCYRQVPQNRSKSPTEIKSKMPPKRKNAVKMPEDMKSC